MKHDIINRDFFFFFFLDYSCDVFIYVIPTAGGGGRGETYEPITAGVFLSGPFLKFLKRGPNFSKVAGGGEGPVQERRSRESVQGGSVRKNLLA